MSTRREFLIQGVATAVATMGAARPGLASAESPRAGSSHAVKTYRIPQTDVLVSRLAYGPANLSGWDHGSLSSERMAIAIGVLQTVFDQGINFLDLADMEGFGRVEETVGEALRRFPGLRSKLILQTKCGMRFKEGGGLDDFLDIDLSRKHIVTAADGSLRRLGTDHLDIMLLHWPDALIQPEEVADAFDTLHRHGKVRYFGVSNYSPAQLELLKSTVRQPLVVNQIYAALAHPGPVVEGAGPFDYCRQHQIQIQTYSPVRGALAVVTAAAQEHATPQIKKAAQTLTDMAKKYSVSPSAVAVAWLLRHPAGIVPIIGPTKSEYVVDDCTADRVDLDREDWYALLAAFQPLPDQAPPWRPE